VRLDEFCAVLTQGDWEMIDWKEFVYDNLTYGFGVGDSITISFQERTSKDLTTHSLTYGELTFSTLAVLLKWI